MSNERMMRRFEPDIFSNRATPPDTTDAADHLRYARGQSELASASARWWVVRTDYGVGPAEEAQLPCPWFAAIEDTCGLVMPTIDEAERVVRTLFEREFGERVTDAQLRAALEESENDGLAHAAGRGARSTRASDGDRPADMSDEYIRTVDGQSEDERRKDLESRDELGTELHRRALHYSTSTRLPQPTPRTHHAWIHRALLGETEGQRPERLKREHRGEATEPTTVQMPHEHGTGCQWCEGGK